MIQALIFDFDGLILDTEQSEFQAWQEVYEEHNVYLPLEQWAMCIGGAAELFDPYVYLESLVGRPVQREEIAVKRRRRHLELLAKQAVLPGVIDYLNDAKRLNLKLGVASSSSHNWVVGHLSQLGLLTYFDYIRCGDEVARKKPDPELYLAVLAALNVEANQAIVLEDSPNGILAARRAGIFCVAVPNPLTSQLSLDHANLQLTSLAAIPLEQLIAKIQQ